MGGAVATAATAAATAVATAATAAATAVSTAALLASGEVPSGLARHTNERRAAAGSARLRPEAL